MELGRSLGRLGLALVGRRPRVTDEEPSTLYELGTRRQLEALERQVGGLEARVNAILLGVVVSIIVEVIKGWR